MLRFLRRLVTLLTTVMIAGVLMILVMLVIRYRTTRAPLPPVITLPSGEEATAFTQGADWYAVVTDGNQILIFARDSGKLRQRISIEHD